MFENAKAELGRDAGFVQAGYCFVLSQDMLEGAKKNVAMQKGLGIVNEWSEGPGFPQHLPEINPDGIAGIVYEPHGGYADPVQATEAYVGRRSSARRRVPRAHAGAAACCARATASQASNSTTAR